MQTFWIVVRSVSGQHRDLVPPRKAGQGFETSDPSTRGGRPEAAHFQPENAHMNVREKDDR